MRILFIIPSYKPAYIYGGPIEAVSNLAEALAGQGHEVTIYTTNANGKDDLSVECSTPLIVDNVTVYYFKRTTGGHLNFSPDLLRTLNQTLSKFDVIHIQSWWNLVAMPAAWICLRHKITPVVSPRGTLTTYTFQHSKRFIKSGFHRLAGRKWLEQTSLLFTSAREQAEALQFVQPLHAEVLPNIHSFPALQHNRVEDDSKMRLLFLGRIDPAKNIEYLLKEITTHLKIPFQLSIAGDGDPAYVDKLKAMTPGDKRIKWLGKVEGVEKFQLLRASDLMVLPSHTENYGNVVLESLSQGTPVLLSDQVGLKDYVIRNHLGWVEQTNNGSWGTILQEIWNDTGTRNAIREQAPKCIAQDFNPIQEASRYIEFYKQHINRSGKS